MVSFEESPDIPSQSFLEKKRREFFFYFEKIHYYKNISQSYSQMLFFLLDRGSAYKNICIYHVYLIIARPLTVGGKNTSRKIYVFKFFFC